MTRTFNTPEELMIALLQGEKWATRPEYGHYSYCNISGNFIEVLPNKVSRLISINSYRCDGKTLWHKVEDKTELDLMKEKYASGDYVLITPTNRARWHIVEEPFFDCDNYKLIHKKHKDILDAYLADNSVEIIQGYENYPAETVQEGTFIDTYDEAAIYEVKPKKKTVSLAMFTCQQTMDTDWMCPAVFETLEDFKKRHWADYFINHHEIPNTRYELEIDDE